MSRLAVRTLKISLKRAWIPSVLEQYLAYFVVEGACNTKVLYGLLRYMCSIHGGEKVPNFLNRKNEAFKRLNAVTDWHYCERWALVEDIGMLRYSPLGKKTSCGPLGHLGVHSPTSLQNAMFYYNGENYALRGIGEQYRLAVSQRIQSWLVCVYRERINNQSGGIGGFNIPNKI